MNKNQTRMIELLEEIREQYEIVKNDYKELIKLTEVWEDLTGEECGEIICSTCPLNRIGEFDVCDHIIEIKNWK